MPISSSHSGAYYYNGAGLIAPPAPVNIVATATGTKTATVTFEAPQWNGGSDITSYTCISSPGNFTRTLNQSNSGSFSFTGLSYVTSYTFSIYATNEFGNGTVGYSNMMTTVPPVGQAEFITAGATTFTVPAGVTSISVVAIGGGGGGYNSAGTGGAGGSLAYRNNYTVTPGSTLNITVGAGGTAGGIKGSNSQVQYNGFLVCLARGGGQSVTNVGTATFAGGNGGSGYSDASQNFPGGGGGAGGYAGAGGYGGSTYLNVNYISRPPTAGTGGAGGGGSAYQNPGGYGGGGVGIYGQGANGSAGGGAGSGGTAGSITNTNVGAPGGRYGGGGGGGAGTKSTWTGNRTGGTGGVGAVRIIWPGNLRVFPASRTANETPVV